MKLLLVLAATATLVGGRTVPAPPSFRMAPRIIMVHGGAVPQRLYLTNWRENLDFVSGIGEPSTPVEAARLAGRRYVDLTLYWEAPKWEKYLATPAALTQLDPADKAAGQGRLYLPTRDEPALLVYQTATRGRVVNAASIELLERYGVSR